ncbi:MAG: hypothetical protein D6681_13230 [Calditrichaeota bacterium]|nr:MAG: hypothetical protein D6681_13230 [Calditrichota bacterium]
MKELLKKVFYFGVGTITVTAEKVEEIVDELIKRGEATQSERGKLIEEFLQKAREQEKAVATKVKDIIQRSRQELGIPSRQEIEALKQRVEALEKQLEARETATSEAAASSRKSKGKSDS